MKKRVQIIVCFVLGFALAACSTASTLLNNTDITPPSQEAEPTLANISGSPDKITVTPTANAVSTQEMNDMPHLEYYEDFDEFNSSQTDYKGFILSEVRIDGEPYYQFLNDAKDIKIIVDQTQQNAIIYHNGEAMNYDMCYLFDYAHLSSGMELCDVTGDGVEELIISHRYDGFGTWFDYCDVISLSSMSQHEIGEYFTALCSRITVEPVRIADDHSLLCRITDIRGNESYGFVNDVWSSDLSDYSFEVSDNTPIMLYANNKKNCLGVSIFINMFDENPVMYQLGSIESYLIFNPGTNRFELSDDFKVYIDKLYTE